MSISHYKGLSLLLLFFFGMMGISTAQKSDHEALMEGNKAYKEGNYSKAEEEYVRALDANPNSVKGHYNRGNAIYKGLDNAATPKERKERLEKATDAYLNAIQNSKNPSTKAKAYYNLGNTYLEQEKYKEGVDAYKQSLRINPNDMDAKTNLQRALMQMQMQQQQQQQQQNSDSEGEGEEQQQQSEQPQDENPPNEDEQNQSEQNQEGDQESDENSNPEDQANEGEKEQQPTPEELSKEEALRKLKVMDEKEKEVLEKLRKEQKGSGQYQSDKDW